MSGGEVRWTSQQEDSEDLEEGEDVGSSWMRALRDATAEGSVEVWDNSEA